MALYLDGNKIHNSLIVNGATSGFVERLCYVNYNRSSGVEIPTINTIDKGDNFNEYLSYDNARQRFYVSQAFDAVIVPWVVNDKYNRNSATGAFYVGSTAGQPTIFHFRRGDTFYSYTPSSQGYPHQYLKIYKNTGMLDYTNEIS